MTVRDVHLAARAAQILENEAWQKAFDEVERGLMLSWASSPPDDWKLREQFYHRLQALRDLKTQLEVFLALGTRPKGNP